MDSDEFKEILVTLLIFLIAFSILVGASKFIDSVVCQAKTENMGFNSEYTFFGGV